jgi:hypothetical protein
VARPLLVLAVALALVAPAAAIVYPVRPSDGPLLARPATPEERLAESVATRLTGHPAVARCSAIHLKTGELGMTPFLNDTPAGYFLISPEMCKVLVAFHAGPAAYDPNACRDTACLQRAGQAALALQTVAHESYHLLGYRNEATTECYGLQSLWYSAVRLGATPAVGEALASLYAMSMYAGRRTSKHPEYWSAECRDGGKLDLRPKSHAWPS